MGSKPETRYYQAVHRLLPNDLYREKMMNPYRGGTPDVWYSGCADDLWAEYKYVARVPQKNPVHVRKLLSELQLLWLRERTKEGRNVVVILGTPVGAWVYEHLRWETEVVTHEKLKNEGLDKREVANYIRRRTMLRCA